MTQKVVPTKPATNVAQPTAKVAEQPKAQAKDFIFNRNELHAKLTELRASGNTTFITTQVMPLEERITKGETTKELYDAVMKLKEPAPSAK